MQIGRARCFWRERVNATRTIACALTLAAATSVQAADISLDTAKDALSNIATSGVTIYGTIDVGYGLNTHGAPVAGGYYLGAEWTIAASKNANRTFSGLVDNALEQSKIGVKIEETIAPGWTAIGRIEDNFDPMFGEVSDICAAMVRNNGRNASPFINSSSTWADGSRCGQAFTIAYGGVSNATYGTLTFGRQQSLELDAIAVYDPMQLSYAFSLIGFSGSAAGGFGDTEAARWDNSVKYVWQYGPAHVAGMYSNGGPDTAIFDGAWGVDAGFTWQGFSIDGVFTKEHSVVAASPLNFGVQNPTTLVIPAGTCNPDLYAASATVPQTGNNCNTNTLNGSITDNTGWSVMAKYTFDFIDCCAGLKDKQEVGPRLTLYAGAAVFQLTDPVDPVAINQTTIGGYFLGNVNNKPIAFGSARNENTEWAGARLELPAETVLGFDAPGNWAFALAWYRFAQDEFVTGAAAGENTCPEITAINAANRFKAVPGTGGPGQPPAVAVFTGKPVAANCAGQINQAAFLVDYALNKYFDVYAGINVSHGDGGFVSGFLQDNITSVASGIRLKF